MIVLTRYQNICRNKNVYTHTRTRAHAPPPPKRGLTVVLEPASIEIFLPDSCQTCRQISSGLKRVEDDAKLNVVLGNGKKSPGS